MTTTQQFQFLIAIIIALVTSFAALVRWCDGKGRPFQTRKSCALTCSTILFLAAVSASVGVFWLSSFSMPFWLASAALPFTVLGTKVKGFSPTDGGQRGALTQLLTSLMAVIALVIALPLKWLKNRMKNDMIYWAQTIDGENKSYMSWTRTKLNKEADILYYELSALIDKDDQVQLGELKGLYDGLYKTYEEVLKDKGPAAALRRAQKAYFDMRCFAYLCGYDERGAIVNRLPAGKVIVDRDRETRRGLFSRLRRTRPSESVVREVAEGVQDEA